MASLDTSGVIVRCPACGTSNRLAYESLGRTTRCGRCKTGLQPPAAPIEVRDPAAFDAAVAKSAFPILVDFWAEWCAPCRMVAPELERVAREAAGRWLVVKVDTDAQQAIAARFRIQSIPTLAVIAGGREVTRMAGARPAAEIQAFVENALAEYRRRAS